jgi:hypothetical protein
LAKIQKIERNAKGKLIFLLSPQVKNPSPNQQSTVAQTVTVKGLLPPSFPAATKPLER